MQPGWRMQWYDLGDMIYITGRRRRKRETIVHVFEHNVPLRCIYMVLTDSRFGSYDVTDDVITYNHCGNFVAKYLGNEARWRDSFNVQPIGTCVWAIDCACFR